MTRKQPKTFWQIWDEEHGKFDDLQCKVGNKLVKLGKSPKKR
jgi:hypothetical protein